MKDDPSETPSIPEAVETLINWTLPNESKPFDEEEFLAEVDEVAADMNSLFDRTFAISAVEQ
jgi:hypothetical protein